LKERKSRIVPGAEGVKVVNRILDRIAIRRQAIQLILSKEFDEPPVNFYNVADKIARYCETPILNAMEGKK